MLNLTPFVRAWAATAVNRLTATRGDDRGAGVIETVVIAAGVAALALSLVAGITVLVNNKLADITL